MKTYHLIVYRTGRVSLTWNKRTIHQSYMNGYPTLQVTGNEDGTIFYIGAALRVFSDRTKSGDIVTVITDFRQRKEKTTQRIRIGRETEILEES